MFGLAADREILRIHLQCRLFVAGAYAARPRHPGCLWAIEVGDRKAVGTRAAGIARDGEDGLSELMQRQMGSSLRANGSRECAPDDRLRRSNPELTQDSGLLRHFAPRNDGCGGAPS